MWATALPARRCIRELLTANGDEEVQEGGEKEREREGEEVVVEDQGGRMCPKWDKMGVTGTLLSGSPPTTSPSLLFPPLPLSRLRATIP